MLSEYNSYAHQVLRTEFGASGISRSIGQSCPDCVSDPDLAMISMVILHAVTPR